MTPFELGLVVLSALLHACWSVAIKGSGDAVLFNALQILPQLVVAAALLPWISFSEVPPDVWWLLVGAGITHSLYLYWMSRAYEEADLSLVYPIARSTPAFLPIFAVPLLGETISVWGALGIAIVVGGIWGVHAGGRVRLADWRGAGTSFAFLTLLCTIGYGLIDKSSMALLNDAAWTSPIPRSIFYYFLITGACGALFLPLALVMRGAAPLLALGRSEARGVLGACVMTVLSYGLLLEALRSAPASYVVATRQISVVFALILGVVWLGERPDRARLWGTAATVVGVAMIGFLG